MKHFKYGNFYDDYFLLTSETKYKTTQGERLKTLIFKQILQILLIVPVQVKTGDTSQNLLNDIKQTVNYLH